MKARKLLLTAIILLFVLMTIFARFFIASEIHHDCCGDNCPICETIAFVEETISKLSLACIVFCVVSLFIYTFGKTTVKDVKETNQHTLITLKVKLSN